MGFRHLVNKTCTNSPDGKGQVWDVRPLWYAETDER